MESLSWQSLSTVVRKKLSQGPCSYAWVCLPQEEPDILRESSELINQTVEDYLQGDDFDWADLKGKVRDNLTKYLFDQTKVVQQSCQS